MSNKEILLNIGCGLDAPEEWLNIDSSPTLKISKIPLVGRPLLSILGSPDWPKSIRTGDLINGLSLPENSCELIFASHVLEHLSLFDCQIAITKLFYYLEPKGTLRIIVPDLAALIANYNNSGSSPKSAYSFMSDSGVGCKDSRVSLIRRITEAISNSRHQWMWDEPSLTEMLIHRGFKDIRRRNYRQWSDSRFGLVERENRHINAVCLEATK